MSNEKTVDPNDPKAGAKDKVSTDHGAIEKGVLDRNAVPGAGSVNEDVPGPAVDEDGKKK